MYHHDKNEVSRSWLSTVIRAQAGQTEAQINTHRHTHRDTERQSCDRM